MIGFAQGFCLASNICSWSDALVAYYLYVSFLAVVWFAGRARTDIGQPNEARRGEE